jgi:adenine deaminase
MPSIIANHIDIQSRTIKASEIRYNTHIEEIIPLTEKVKNFVLPGFVDAHVHIESSMLVPSEFARLAVVHGTVGTVSDPHEIANVLGMEGVDYMIANGKKVNFKFNFGAPSCVPATSFETAGAEINVDEIKELLQNPEIKYLAEMMNWPGVLHADPMVMAKIAAAKELQKPIDGHAPGLMGADAEKYIKAGISTDHECTILEEAKHKLANGMKIMIREGSAAKNFEALFPIIDLYPDMVMFCSDDKHPDYLVKSHINELVKRAVAKGLDFFNILQAACINPILHYNLDIGILRVGDPADFIVIDEPKHFNILQTYINGELVAEKGDSKIQSMKSKPINNFKATPIAAEDLKLEIIGKKVRVIKALDGQLITEPLLLKSALVDNKDQCSIDNDLLKLVVVNRYDKTQIAVAYINNFGLARGAISSTVAHDSHNIIAVGTSDTELTKVINALISTGGGINASDGKVLHHLALDVAGLMSTGDGYKVAEEYTAIDNFTKKELGSTLTSPFMTLSFMALLVIPSIKLSDKGLFDAANFNFCNVFED